ncbi:hypothetical protein, partial [Pseudomonas viridiflava]|uniref:hypothetical protein n=1 Tax=Pseudomonas viridiflava TaxID=33069 RepID=UPI003C743363
MATSRWTSCHRCSPDGWSALPVRDESTISDRLTWAEIRRLALRHRKSLWIANSVAVLATLCSVPIP